MAFRPFDRSGHARANRFGIRARFSGTRGSVFEDVLALPLKKYGKLREFSFIRIHASLRIPKSEKT